MHKLQQNHPDVFTQFSEGSFVVHKTKHAFSAIALDHNHEQTNALVKRDGGAIGLTQDPGHRSRGFKGWYWNLKAVTMTKTEDTMSRGLEYTNDS